jgi:FkbM family methyltransferase
MKVAIKRLASSAAHRLSRMTRHDVSRVGIALDYLAYELNGQPRPPAKVVESIHYWEQLKRHMEQAAISLVLDVGANEGQFASGLRKLGYRGPIVSFEPNPDVAARLQKRADADAMWQVLAVAAGDEAGEATLHVGGDSAFASFRQASSYGKERFQAAIAGQREVHAPIRRLDDVLESDVRVGSDANVFLKLDTQGWDLPAFRGLGHEARKVRLLQVEMSFEPLYEQAPEFVEAISFFRRQGFRPTGFFPVCEDPVGHYLVEVDCLMVRAGEGRS